MSTSKAKISKLMTTKVSRLDKIPVILLQYPYEDFTAQNDVVVSYVNKKRNKLGFITGKKFMYIDKPFLTDMEIYTNNLFTAQGNIKVILPKKNYKVKGYEVIKKYVYKIEF